MNLKNSTGIVVPTAVLTILCAVVAVLLALTNEATADKIAEQEVENAKAARMQVLDDADDFTELQLDAALCEKYNIVDAYTADNGVGVVITTLSKGYGGEMKVMTGIRSDGTISKVEILSSEETPGLGKKTEDDAFISQYDGKSGTLSVVKNTASSEQDIVAVAGATMSSKAVTLAVNNAVAAAEEGGLL